MLGGLTPLETILFGMNFRLKNIAFSIIFQEVKFKA